jgi:hypothetical protein
MLGGYKVRSPEVTDSYGPTSRTRVLMTITSMTPDTIILTEVWPIPAPARSPSW